MDLGTYEDQFRRTGRPFGGLVKDITKRYPLYWSDITDVICLQSISTIIFMYMATVTQAVTIGALIGKSQLFIKKKPERNRKKVLKIMTPLVILIGV